MIDKSRIDSAFQQNGDSCVLASYAIALNYFTGFDIGKCFEAYCQYFDSQPLALPYSNWKEAEQQYITDFPRRYQNRLGYEVITELHEKSSVLEFDRARQLFTHELIRDVNPHLRDLEKILKTEEALLNITYRLPNGWHHSVAAFYSENGFLIKNTTKRGIEEIGSLANIGEADMGTLCDALLLTRK